MAIGLSGTQILSRTATTFSGTTFSMCGWFYVTALPGSGVYYTIAGRGNNCVQLLGGGTCKFGLGTDTNDYFSGTPTSIVTNTYYFWGYSRNASNVFKAYLAAIGNSAALEVTSSADTNAGTSLIYGSYTTGGNSLFSGYLALPRIWDGSELSLAEFQAEKNSSTPVKTTPWSYYNFVDNATATTDNSGNSRTLTKTGTVTTQTDPSIGSGGVTATPTGVAATMSVGAPVVTLTDTNIPTGLSATFSLGSPNVSTGANPTINPAGLQMNSSIGTFTVEVDLTSIPIGLESATALGTPTVLKATTNIPTGVALASSLGTPTVVLPKDVFPAGLSGTLSLGSPSIVTGGGLTNSPVGLQSTMGLGTPQVNLTQVMLPVGLAMSSSLGIPNVGSGGGGMSAGRRGGSRARRSPF